MGAAAFFSGAVQYGRWYLGEGFLIAAVVFVLILFLVLMTAILKLWRKRG